MEDSEVALVFECINAVLSKQTSGPSAVLNAMTFREYIQL
jgi:hypothetical protein